MSYKVPFSHRNYQSRISIRSVFSKLGCLILVLIIGALCAFFSHALVGLGTSIFASLGVLNVHPFLAFISAGFLVYIAIAVVFSILSFGAVLFKLVFNFFD